MKQSFLLGLVVLFFPLDLAGQYTDKQYDVWVEREIYVGASTDYAGCLQELFLDLYKPINNDPCRPLLVLLHGGAFTEGDKGDPSIVRIARDMASRGYVVASANYRKGWHLRSQSFSACDAGCWAASLLSCNRYAADSAEVLRAAYRGMQDAKGAIRFLKTRTAMDSTSRARVFVGGEDAGGAIALLVGFLDKETERPAACLDLPPPPPPGPGCAPPAICPDLSRLRPDLGSMEGELHLSKSFGAEVAGVLSLSGFLPDPSWLENTAYFPSLYLFHQRCDPVYPCFGGTLYQQFSLCLQACCPQPDCPPITNMPTGYGGGALANYLKDNPGLGIVHRDDVVVNGQPIDPGYGCQGNNGGIPYCSNPNYAVCHDFLFNTLRMEDIAGFLNTNMPPADCFVYTRRDAGLEQIQVYPNPLHDRIHIAIPQTAPVRLLAVSLFSTDGQRLVRERAGQPRQHTLDTSNLYPGLYILQLETTSGMIALKVVVAG